MLPRGSNLPGPPPCAATAQLHRGAVTDGSLERGGVVDVDHRSDTGPRRQPSAPAAMQWLVRTADVSTSARLQFCRQGICNSALLFYPQSAPWGLALVTAGQTRYPRNAASSRRLVRLIFSQGASSSGSSDGADSTRAMDSGVAHLPTRTLKFPRCDHCVPAMPRHSRMPRSRPGIQNTFCKAKHSSCFTYKAPWERRNSSRGQCRRMLLPEPWTSAPGLWPASMFHPRNDVLPGALPRRAL